MTSPIPRNEAVTTENDRLDHLTETRLAQFASASFDVGYTRARLDDRREADATAMRSDARNALRSRIHQLIEEARLEGFKNALEIGKKLAARDVGVGEVYGQ